MWKDAAVALSLANLCFLKLWTELLHEPNHYYRHDAPAPALLAGTVAAVLLVAATAFAGLRLGRRLEGAAGNLVTGLVLGGLWLIALNCVRLQLPFLSGPRLAGALGPAGLGLLAAVLLAAGALALRRWPGRLARAARLGALCLLPFLAITLARTGHLATAGAARAFASGAPVPVAAAPGADRPRLLWHVFDELDQRLLFEDRPGGLGLPAVDALAEASVRATQALPPAGDTLLSLPGLIDGARYKAARPTGVRELLVAPEDSANFSPWGKAPNLFSEARERGLRTGLAGWYHPYCRLFAGDLARCRWQSYRDFPRALSLIGALGLQLREFFFSWPLTYRLFDPNARRHRRSHAEQYKTAASWAASMAGDPALDLVFLHWPVPHHPFVFNRATARFDDEGGGDYFGNLVLVDRALELTQQVMRDAGLWERSAVIVTSDHGWRAARPQDERVPLLVRLPGQRRALTVSARINTAALKDLALLILDGQVHEPEQVAAFLEKRAGPGR